MSSYYSGAASPTSGRRKNRIPVKQQQFFGVGIENDPVKDVPGVDAMTAGTTSSLSSSVQRRRAMTGRRLEMTERIRKAKRSQLVSLKRRLRSGGSVINGDGIDGGSHNAQIGTPIYGTSHEPGACSASPVSCRVELLTSLCFTYLSKGDEESLGRLQATLSSGDLTDSGLADALLSRRFGGSTNSINTMANASSMPWSCGVLVDALARSLSSPQSTEQMKLDASRVLTNLAAGESRWEDEKNYDDDDIAGAGGYYGPAAATAGDSSLGSYRGWCHIIIKSGSALPALVGAVEQFVRSSVSMDMSTSTTALRELRTSVDLCEQCCWALGNLGGDSQIARDAVRSAGAVRPLVCALRIGFRLRNFPTTSAIAGPISHSETKQIGVSHAGNVTVGLCRNAAWALSNLVRGADTSALPFLDMAGECAAFSSGMAMNTIFASSPSLPSASVVGDLSQASPLLSARDLCDVLTSPEIVISEAGLGGMSKCAIPFPTGVQLQPTEQRPLVSPDVLPATWLDVAFEGCWMLAFLTAREDNAVDFLCAPLSSGRSDGGGDFDVCDALTLRLANAVERTAASKTATESGSGGSVAIGTTSERKMCVPCVRAIGNIAMACDGRHVERLCRGGGDNMRKSIAVSSIAESLASLIGFGCGTGLDSSSSADSDIKAVAPEAAWAAGTLLCDAGYDLPHPSTASCRILVPSLCAALTSGYARLDLKREACAALWNAVTSPPSSVASKIVATTSDGVAAAPAFATVGGDAAKSVQWSTMSIPTSIMTVSSDISSFSNYEDPDTLQVRNEILRQVVLYPGVIPALVRLVVATDVDAAMASLLIVNATYRRLIQSSSKGVGDGADKLRTKFDECGVLDALETICDRPLCPRSTASFNQHYYGRLKGSKPPVAGHGGRNSSAAADFAEMAAGLIDDFFEEDMMLRDEEEEDAFIAPNVAVTASNVPSSFAFGLARTGDTTPQMEGFDFDSSGNVIGNGVSLDSSRSLLGLGRGRGRGRGRGKIMPAWMTMQEQPDQQQQTEKGGTQQGLF